jgi:hypothetical protein
VGAGRSISQQDLLQPLALGTAIVQQCTHTPLINGGSVRRQCQLRQNRWDVRISLVSKYTMDRVEIYVRYNCGGRQCFSSGSVGTAIDHIIGRKKFVRRLEIRHEKTPVEAQAAEQ